MRVGFADVWMCLNLSELGFRLYVVRNFLSALQSVKGKRIFIVRNVCHCFRNVFSIVNLEENFGTCDSTAIAESVDVGSDCVRLGIFHCVEDRVVGNTKHIEARNFVGTAMQSIGPFPRSTADRGEANDLVARHCFLVNSLCVGIVGRVVVGESEVNFFIKYKRVGIRLAVGAVCTINLVLVTVGTCLICPVVGHSFVGGVLRT